MVTAVSFEDNRDKKETLFTTYPFVPFEFYTVCTYSSFIE